MIIGLAGSSRRLARTGAFGSVAHSANGPQKFGNLEAKIPSTDGKLGCRLQLLRGVSEFLKIHEIDIEL